MNILIVVMIGSVAVLAIALWWGAYRWESETERMHARLKAGRNSTGSKPYSSSELVDLPAPVQRYFRAVLTEGQPIVAAVYLEQVGKMNMSVSGESWKPFTASQLVITECCGFDWDARIRMLPGLTARVHDAYIAGEGMLQASLFGLFSMANARGTAEMAHGELLRYFAEATWYPTALLPSQGVHWKAVDDCSAEATMKDGETVATLLFRFDSNGLIASMRAESRARGVDGVLASAPWEGHWSNYEHRGDMLIPTAGEVAWILPEGTKTYWRGRITNLRYEFA